MGVVAFVVRSKICLTKALVCYVSRWVVVDMLQILLVIIASLLAAAYAAGGMSPTGVLPSWMAQPRLHNPWGDGCSLRLAAFLRNVCGCPWFAPSLAWAPVAPARSRRRPWPLDRPPGGGGGPGSRFDES